MKNVEKHLQLPSLIIIKSGQNWATSKMGCFRQMFICVDESSSEDDDSIHYFHATLFDDDLSIYTKILYKLNTII